MTRLNDGEPSTSTVDFSADGRALIKDWIDGTMTNNGLIIHGDSGENYQQKILSDDTDDSPRLNLVYASSCGN